MTFQLKQMKQSSLGSKELSLQIWDTPGTEIYLKQMQNCVQRNNFWRNVSGLIVMADYNDVGSLEVA